MPPRPRSTPGPPTTDATRVLDSIRRIVRVLLRGSNEAEKRTGMSGAQLFVLQQLADGRPRSMREIATLTLTHQSTVSVVVGRLAAKKLVARASDPTDRRRVLLTLTAAGRGVLRRAPDSVPARLAETLARIPRRDIRVVARHLDIIVREIGGADTRPGMFLEP